MDRVKKRVNVDLDEIGMTQLKNLERDFGSVSYGETIRAFLVLTDYIRQEAIAGKGQLDLEVVRRLFFSRAK